MDEKLIERVKVEVQLLRVKCPNPECSGVLEFDGKSRTKDGVHGGTPEYRHRCNTCTTGYWIAEQYPKVHYELGEVIQEPEPPPPPKRKQAKWNE